MFDWLKRVFGGPKRRGRCPTEAQLRDRLVADVAGKQHARLDAHIEDCRRCQDLLTTITQFSFGPSGLPNCTADGFEVVELIGEGGMGVVYKAYQSALGRMVALKMIRPALLGSPTAVARFRNEARQAARISHPNIIHIHEVIETACGPVLVMEYLSG